VKNFFENMDSDDKVVVVFIMAVAAVVIVWTIASAFNGKVL